MGVGVTLRGRYASTRSLLRPHTRRFTKTSLREDPLPLNSDRTRSQGLLVRPTPDLTPLLVSPSSKPSCRPFTLRSFTQGPVGPYCGVGLRVRPGYLRYLLDPYKTDPVASTLVDSTWDPSKVLCKNCRLQPLRTILVPFITVGSLRRKRKDPVVDVRTRGAGEFATREVSRGPVTGSRSY